MTGRLPANLPADCSRKIPSVGFVAHLDTVDVCLKPEIHPQIVKDYDGKDISERINIYGKVDTFKRGVYKIRCVVTSERQLACTKYINVIVE